MIATCSVGNSLPAAVARRSVPSSPTSVRLLWVKSRVAPLSGELARASARCWSVNEAEGEGDRAPLRLVLRNGDVRPTTRSASEEDMGGREKRDGSALDDVERPDREICSKFQVPSPPTGLAN